MKLYALSYYFDYEGSNVIGIYDSRDKAEENGVLYMKDDMGSSDGFCISEIELNEKYILIC